MKDARHSKAESSVTLAGASIVSIGSYPAKRATVTAEVLARLLAGERLTSIDAVSEASTTRLSAIVHYIAKEYGWTVDAKEKAAGCRDGRVSWVAEYSLAPETIAAAMAADAASWCASVHSARAKLRAKASDAYRFAARANAGQVARTLGGLLDGEGVAA